CLQYLFAAEFGACARTEEIRIKLRFEIREKRINVCECESALQLSHIKVITFDDASAQCVSHLARNLSCHEWIAIHVASGPEDHTNAGMLFANRTGKLRL